MGKTTNKAHRDGCIVYDALSVLSFPGYTPGGSVANSVIAARLPLMVAMKFYAVVISCASGTTVTAFNVIRDTAADASPTNPIGTNDNSATYTLTGNVLTGGGYPPTVAATGTAFFAADQAVTIVAGVPQSFFFPNYDVIWPQNALLTLRLVASGAAGLVQVNLLGKPYDIQPQRPSGETAGFAPSTDIV